MEEIRRNRRRGILVVVLVLVTPTAVAGWCETRRAAAPAAVKMDASFVMVVLTIIFCVSSLVVLTPKQYGTLSKIFNAFVCCL
jgi:hypothetical protein